MLGRVESPVEVHTSVETTRIVVAVRNVYTVVVEATVYVVHRQEGLVNEMVTVMTISGVMMLGIVLRIITANLLQEIGAPSDLTVGHIVVVVAMGVANVGALIWRGSWKKSKPLLLEKQNHKSDELYAF